MASQIMPEPHNQANKGNDVEGNKDIWWVSFVAGPGDPFMPFPIPGSKSRKASTTVFIFKYKPSVCSQPGCAGQPPEDVNKHLFSVIREHST